MTTTPEEMELTVGESGSTVNASHAEARSKSKHKVVVVDEQHPFDLEDYLSSYKGRTAYARAAFIAHHCPALAPRAYQLALRYIQQGNDVATYLQVVTAYNALSGVSSVMPDQMWVDASIAKNAKDKEKLEVELKMYSSNMIKESVRMSHRELGLYYHSIGDHSASLRNHMKSREFCTSATHVVEMCLSVLEVLLEQQTYGHLSTYIYKAETALDAAQPSTQSAASGSKKIPSPEKAIIQAKLEFASAMADMGAARFDKAAYGFLKMKNDIGDWKGKVVTPSDIAVYGTLCALASLSRSAIKAAVVESETFGYFLEQEPYIREILDAYMASKFKDVLYLVDRHSSRHLLDIHLSNHVDEIQRQIRNRALVLYFQPFASVHLDRMATAFGVDLAEMEANVVKLIEEGLIKARIDSQNKILKAKDHNPRVELYKKAIAAGVENQASTRKVLWRMKLMKEDIFIRPPKSQGQNGQSTQQNSQQSGWEYDAQ